jgi:hypothetical protein
VNKETSERGDEQLSKEETGERGEGGKKRRRKKVKKDQGDDLKACKQEVTLEGKSKEFGAEEE